MVLCEDIMQQFFLMNFVEVMKQKSQSLIHYATQLNLRRSVNDLTFVIHYSTEISQKLCR